MPGTSPIATETYRRWWQTTKAIVCLLIFFPPVGLILVWTSSDWTKSRKKTATVLGGLWFLIVAGSGSTTPPQQNFAGSSTNLPQQGLVGPSLPNSVGQPLNTAKATATSVGYLPRSHDASEGDASQFDDGNWVVCFQAVSGNWVDFGVVRINTPCPVRDGEPVPWPKVPNLVQWKFVDAEAKLIELGASSVSPRAAYVDQQPPPTPDDWIVCFQDPVAGSDAKPSFYASLSLVAPGISCPQQQGTYLNPPDPDPDPDPDVRHVPDPSDRTGGTSDDSSEDSGGAAYYSNCKAARAAGAAPIYAGEPGYRSALDRNHDGVACE